MQGEEAPISFKERLARYEKLMTNPGTSSNPSPTFKQTQPKTNPSPPPASQSPPTPPITSSNVKNQGEVESPAVVKPSLNKTVGPSNTLNLQSNPSFRMSTGPTVSQGYQPSPSVNLEFNRASVSGINNEGVDSTSVLSVNILKQMLEGKNMNLNQPSQVSPSKRFVARPAQEQEDHGQKQAPTTETNKNVGSVRENAQKLNLFFQNQRESERIKGQSEENRNEVLPQTFSQEKAIENNVIAGLNVKQAPLEQSNTQNITGNANFYVPPELSHSAQSGALEKTQASSGGQQEGGLMARLKKKKKMTRENFDSDED